MVCAGRESVVSTRRSQTRAASADIRRTGLQLAKQVILPRAGFVNICLTSRSGYAHLYAERDGASYAICVRARNKYEVSGPPNPRYKLIDKPKDLPAQAARAEADLNATAAWLVIPIDPEAGVFSAYFGLLSDLHGNAGVPMKDEDVEHYECLASNERIDDAR